MVYLVSLLRLFQLQSSNAIHHASTVIQAADCGGFILGSAVGSRPPIQHGSISFSTVSDVHRGELAHSFDPSCRLSDKLVNQLTENVPFEVILCSPAFASDLVALGVAEKDVSARFQSLYQIMVSAQRS